MINLEHSFDRIIYSILIFKLEHSFDQIVYSILIFKLEPPIVRIIFSMFPYPYRFLEPYYLLQYTVHFMEQSY